MKFYQFIICLEAAYNHELDEPFIWFVSDLYSTKAKAETAAEQKIKESWCYYNDANTYDSTQEDLSYYIEERTFIK